MSLAAIAILERLIHHAEIIHREFFSTPKLETATRVCNPLARKSRAP
jgi:hypothetical protein